MMRHLSEESHLEHEESQPYRSFVAQPPDGGGAGVTLEEWWRNEQFWVIGGTSAHLAAVFQV